jgi:hypothetical protein
MRRRAQLVVLYLVACASDRGRDTVGATGIPPGVGSAGSEDAGVDGPMPDGDPTGANGDTTGSDDGDGGGPKLDVGGDSTMGGDPTDGTTEIGCEKVDLLFVIDDSISMDDEQAALIAAFPDFITAMQTELADTDGYNIGVITSDAYAGDPTCAPGQRGVLVTQTAGDQSSNQVCGPYSSGARHMTEQEDDLAARFSCAAQVGVAGDPDERPIEAMLAALSAEMNGPGDCNTGFVRDDALLVVVLITDEEDDHENGGCNWLPNSGSVGEPPQWFQQLIAVKGGVESSIVVLAIVGPDQMPFCPPLDKCNLGSTGSEIGARIIDFTEMFTYGYVGSVCEPYGPQFQDAISIIDSACDDFEPPG